MRKIVIFFIAVIALLYFGKADLIKFNDDFQGDYVVYSRQETGEKVFAVNGVDIYKGKGFDLLKTENIEGETITFKGNSSDVKLILKKLFVIYYKTEQIDDVYIVYGYSPRLKRTIFVNGVLQNVQITLRGDTITVSNPINLGSY